MNDQEIAEIEERARWADVDFGSVRHRAPKRVKAPANGLLDIKQAAAYLGISAKWLYRSYHNFPHILIPAGKKPRIRFRQSALDQWIANHEFDFRKRRVN